MIAVASAMTPSRRRRERCEHGADIAVRGFGATVDRAFVKGHEDAVDRVGDEAYGKAVELASRCG